MDEARLFDIDRLRDELARKRIERDNAWMALEKARDEAEDLGGKWQDIDSEFSSILHAIERAEKSLKKDVNGWTPVETPPPANDEYIIATVDMGVTVCSWNGYWWGSPVVAEQPKVTHWRPLPAPPEAECEPSDWDLIEAHEQFWAEANAEGLTDAPAEP